MSWQPWTSTQKEASGRSAWRQHPNRYVLFDVIKSSYYIVTSFVFRVVKQTAFAQIRVLKF